MAPIFLVHQNVSNSAYWRVSFSNTRKRGQLVPMSVQSKKMDKQRKLPISFGLPTPPKPLKSTASARSVTSSHTTDLFSATTTVESWKVTTHDFHLL